MKLGRFIVRKLLFKYNNITTTIRYSIFNLKTTQLLLNNQYYFIIDSKYNKKLIKKFIEYLFNIKVNKVTTSSLFLNSNKLLNYKKVIVTLSKKKI
jgi:ribosomal protein L23